MNENEVKQWRDQAEKFRKGECVLCAWGGKRGGKTDPDTVRAVGSRAGHNFSFHGQNLPCSLQYILSHGDQFMCFIEWGFRQSSREVISK